MEDVYVMDGQNKLKLLARNEGKIKSHESCFDVRAWSHDNQVRNYYVRDWIRSDMPICVIPVSTVSSYWRTMTRRSRERSIPRCQPNCKSKIVLDSICTSCHAMKECLKNDQNFEKYFEDEEFETSHWPCDRCLEALKNIKMFWRIICERIFNISIPKNDDLGSAPKSNESVQSVAKAWQEELVQQAIVVKNLTPLLNINSQSSLKPANSWKFYTKYLKKIMTLDNIRFVVDDDEDNTSDTNKKLNVKSDNCKDVATETDSLSYSGINKRSSRSLRKKISKCTSFRVKTVDFSGDTCNRDNEENSMYKNNFDYLQQRYNVQSDEVKQLKRENISLKFQLQNLSKNREPSYSPMISDNNVSVILKPYESYCENECVNNIDSETIITLKNCKNKKFKHVSMLQVLHKTNDSLINAHLDESSCKKNEDPIKILTKVHSTFGAIVRRELIIANQKKCDPREVQIEASYHRFHASRSVPSCSAVSSRPSDLVFVSTTEV